MAKGYKASDYILSQTGVQFTCDAPWLMELYERCEAHCIRNLAVFTDKKVLREGSDYDGVWLETQPMGGEMYAKRDMEAALNNQLIFMENQRKIGRLPGMIKYQEPFLLQVSYDWLQEFCFPVPALKMYYLIGKDRAYLEKLYDTLCSFDQYLWTYRDSDRDGCLESWCTWDTGEDNSMRFTRYGVKDGGFGGEDAPIGHGRLPYESMDVMSYSYQCRDVLARICDLLGNGEGDMWRQEAQKVRNKLRSYLWIEKNMPVMTETAQMNLWTYSHITICAVCIMAPLNRIWRIGLSGIICLIRMSSGPMCHFLPSLSMIPVSPILISIIGEDKHKASLISALSRLWIITAM